MAASSPTTTPAEGRSEPGEPLESARQDRLPTTDLTESSLLPLPDLLLLTNLLSRLLAKLEEPSGELDTALAQVLTELSSLAGAMGQAAQALEAAAGPEGALGRIEAEMRELRQEQRDQRDLLEALARRT